MPASFLGFCATSLKSTVCRWATHQGAELGLVMLKGARGVEFKRADVPRVTRSMGVAIDDLKLDALYVVCPGEQRFTRMEGVEAVPLWALLSSR